MSFLRSSTLATALNAALVAIGVSAGCQHGALLRDEAAAPPPPTPREAAAVELRLAYESLAFGVGLLHEGTPAGAMPLAVLTTKATSVYRAASARFARGDFAAATELARAAHDAGRGLEHMARARFTTLDALTPPPEAPVLPPPSTREDSLAALPPGADAAGHPFLDASRQLHEQAAAAVGAGAVSRARELAVASEAFRRVDEHLFRARHPELAAMPPSASPEGLDKAMRVGPLTPASPAH